MILASMAFIAGIFSSCKKDYTCTCEEESYGETYEAVYTYEGVKEADAEDMCATAESSWDKCKLDQK